MAASNFKIQLDMEFVLKRVYIHRINPELIQDIILKYKIYDSFKGIFSSLGRLLTKLQVPFVLRLASLSSSSRR